MARHETTIPIIKSSNDSQGIHTGWGNMFYPPYTSSVLYISNCYSTNPSNNERIESVNNIGLAWDLSQIPSSKKIVSVKLYIYAKYSYSSSFAYRKVQFNEGMSIPSIHPSTGSISGKFASGWNAIDLPADIGDSIVIGDTILRKITSDSQTRWGEFNSHRASSNKPYVVIVYDDAPPNKPTSLYPSGITVSTRDVIRFAWLHNSNEELEQKGFTLEYSKDNGATWTIINQTTPNQYYDMPANTLPTSGTVMWRVKTIDGNDEVSEFASASFTLGVPPQKAPIPLGPISQYLDANNPIRFEWSFKGGSDNEKQSKFDLQYSIDGGNTWTTKTVTTEDEFYETSASTFSGGNVTWKVRTYNNYNEVSPYSENKTFTVIGSPPLPLISNVSNKARPVISWTSQQQHLYELEILKDNKVIFETGSIPSTSDKSFKVPIYLNDGTYKVRLRVANEYNLFSPWAEKSFIISTVKPSKPIVTVYSGEYGVTIKTSNTSLKTYVYRDNEYIGEVVNNHFVDYTGENNKEYQYFIRTIDFNDNFSDSDIKLAKCRFNGNTLALSNSPEDFIKLKTGLNSNPKKSNQFAVAGSLQNYDGRKYPVIEFSEFNNMSKTLSFYVKTKKEIDRLIEMIEKRKAFIYRNRDGSNIYGTILSVDYDEEETFQGYEIGFTIIMTDYKGVAYD